MKKLFYAVVALSLFATSCAKESAEAPEATGKTKRVTFSIKAPEMQVRSGEGSRATKLYYAFYDENGDVLKSLPNSLSGEEWNGLGEGKTIEVTLVEGREYTAIFWAQSPGAKHSPDLETTKSVTFTYVSTGQPEQQDAFFACVPSITTANPKNEETILLKRPFAQLNIGVPFSDSSAAVNAGVNVASTAVKVTIPHKLDLMTGNVSETNEVVLGWDQAGASVFPHEGTDYLILSCNYILVGTEKSDKELKNVVFMMSEQAWNSEESDFSDAITRPFSAVPIERNHRTYVLGNIITSSEGKINYVVKVAPGFDNEGNPTIDQE